MLSKKQTNPCLSHERGQFLWLSGLALLIYVGLAIFYATPAWSAPRALREVLLWITAPTLLCLYYAGYRLITTQKIPMPWLLISGGLLAVAATLIPPFHSTDVFGYINRGWQQLHYGLNPYVYTVDQIPHWENDPMITDHWVNNPSPYGFLYLLIARGLCGLAHGGKAATLMVFKLGNLLIHALTALLLWRGSRVLGQQTGVSAAAMAYRPETMLFLYLWNPLILLHGLANGHNDIFMGFFILAGAVLALMGHGLWLLPMLTAATLIKYGAIVLMPLSLLFLTRRDWRQMAGGLLLSVLVFLAAGWPYLADWPHFHLKEIGRNAFVSHGSLHAAIYSAFKTFAKTAWPVGYAMRETVRDVLKNILLLGYGVFLGALWLQRFRQKAYPVSQWLRDALLVLVLLVCLISLKFYPWYPAMFFPLALLLPEGDRLRGFVVVLSGAQLFSLTFIGQAHFLNFLVMTGLPLVWLLVRLKRPVTASPVAPGDP